MPDFIVRVIRTETWTNTHRVTAASRVEAEAIAEIRDSQEEREGGDVSYVSTAVEDGHTLARKAVIQNCGVPWALVFPDTAAAQTKEGE